MIISILYNLKHNFQVTLNSGIKNLLVKILYYGIILFSSIFLFPLSLIMHWLGFRVTNVLTSRIGHLALEPYSILLLKKINNLNLNFVILLNKKTIANYKFACCWKTHFIVSEALFVRIFWQALSFWGLCFFDVSGFLNADPSKQKLIELINWHGTSLPKLTLSEKSAQVGIDIFNKLGLSDRKIVCVHSRSEGYCIADDSIQAYRNTTFGNYVPAIKKLISLGFVVVKFGFEDGDSEFRHKNFIRIKDLGDNCEDFQLFCMAKCKFFLGNTSGICFVSSVFGRPVAMANIVPVGAFPFFKGDMGIPKKYLKDKKLVSFKDSLSSNYLDSFSTHKFEEQGIYLIENSSSEIIEMCSDMLTSHDDGTEKYGISLDGLLIEKHYSYKTQATIAKSYFNNQIDAN